MRIFLTIMFFFLSANCSLAKGYDFYTPVPGDSIANNALQFYVLRDIYGKSGKKYPACYDFSIINTQVTKYPYDVKKKDNRYIAGFWEELWTADVCGQKITVPVSYKIHKNYTDFYIDPFLF